MKMVIVAVRDVAAQVFNNPMALPSTAMAVRSFHNEVKRGGEDNMIAKFPRDFELWQIALFDTESGEFVPAMERLARGVDVVEVKE